MIPPIRPGGKPLGIGPSGQSPTSRGDFSKDLGPGVFKVAQRALSRPRIGDHSFRNPLADLATVLVGRDFLADDNERCHVRYGSLDKFQASAFRCNW